VHIVCSDWLDPYRYEAISASGHSFKGFLMVHSYELDEKHNWLFKDTFECAKAK
jgi:hypothetical protein